MTIYRYAGKTTEIRVGLPSAGDSAVQFIVCAAEEAMDVIGAFGWDESTALECTNLDETVRHTGFDGYDFVSLVVPGAEGGALAQREVNLFFEKRRLVLVMPSQKGLGLTKLEERMKKAAESAHVRSAPLVYLYYNVFDEILAGCSESLEQLEDRIEELSERISERPRHEQMNDIGVLRKAAYTFKKLLRAMSYIGGQIIMDENKLLGGDTRYFRSIDSRLIKQYDFADSLYDLSNNLLQIYDSKFSAQMTETVNKLTAITLVFGPLTFIAGVYGMNFDFMPELRWPFGYPLALAAMAAVGIGTFFFIRRNKWV